MTTGTRARPRSRGFFNVQATMFLVPILAVFLAIHLVPLLYTIYYSFTNYKGFSKDIHWVGFQNYVRVFNNPNLLNGVFFTVLFAAVTTIVITIIAVPLAVFLNQKFLGQAFARSLFFFLGVPSQAILGLVWHYVFSPLKSGALNTVLAYLGIDPIPWLANNNWARFCVIAVAVWSAVGWHATLYIAYLQSIPSDIYEQAMVDGATAVQRFFHITVPQLIPAIVISSFLLLSSGLKVYDLPYTMTGGGPGYATHTVTQLIIEQCVSEGNYGVGSALGVIFTVLSGVIVFSQVFIAGRVSRSFS